MVFNRSNTGIVSLNPARGIDVCPRFSVLRCPVWVVALRKAVPPSKESYQMSKFQKSNSKAEKVRVPNPTLQRNIIYGITQSCLRYVPFMYFSNCVFK
jgi:hypothetical protein